MKHKLNIWMVLLAAVLALGLVTGCGSSDDDDSSSASASADASGSSSDAAAPAADAADDAADADDSAANTFDFKTLTPQGLTATVSGGIGVKPAQVTLSCGALKTASQFVFTTTIPSSDTVSASVRTVTRTAPNESKKYSCSVYAINAAGENSKTASISFSVIKN